MPVAKINSFDFLCEQHGKHCEHVVLLNTKDVNLWEEKAVANRYMSGAWWDGGVQPLCYILLSGNGAVQGSTGGQSTDLENQELQVFRTVILS